MGYQYTYSEEPEAKLQSIQSALGNENISYDKLGRVHKIDLAPITKEFAYLKKGNYTSNLVSKINFATNNVINDNLTYKYDEKGNITEVRQYNKLIARYKYDALSRIIREDNKEFNTSTTFEYDAGGNILCKKVYAFTIVDNLDFEDELEYIPYTYPISGWRDQILSYNGQEIKDYDGLGNPWFYRGNQLQWSHGRQLDAFADVATYTYNANGIRTSKFANGFTTSYLLNGNKIIKQHDTLNLFDFYYGATGIEGFHLLSKNINGTVLVDGSYYYKKNAQNDIIGIVDANGTLIATYSYDAWGNHICKYLSNNGEYVAIENDYVYNDTSIINRFIAYKNPFRYRSYYYDFETGLYYLNSRYYDPELGRFINADDISILSEGKEFINGLNLYLYCNNNPIMNTDETGNAWWEWLIGIIILAVAIVATVVTAGAAAGTIAAAIHGIAVAATITGVTSAAVGFVSGGVTYNNGNIGWNWEGAAEGFMWGAITGVVSGAISGGLGSIGSLLKKPLYTLVQAGINGLVSFSVTSVQGIITKSFSLHNSILSFVFGALGGFLSVTKLGEGIKNIFTGIGLSITENFINEIVEWLLSKTNTNKQIELSYS